MPASGKAAASPKERLLGLRATYRSSHLAYSLQAPTNVVSVTVYRYHVADYHEVTNSTSAGFWQSGVHLILDFQTFYPFSYSNDDTGGIVSKLVRETKMVRVVGY